MSEQAGIGFAASLLIPVGTSPDAWLPPAPSGTPARVLVGHLAQRAAVTGRRLRTRGTTVPLRPAGLRTGPRASVLRWLASGVVVLPAGEGFPPAGSALGQVVREAGLVFPAPRFWAGSGGSLVAPAARGDEPVVLRVFPSSAADQREHAQRTLQHLEAHAVRRAPRPVGAGETEGLLWLVESRLPGHRPRRTPARLLAEALDFCVALPRDPGAAVGPDQRVPAVLDPSTAERLRSLGRETAAAWAHEPPAGTHGDFWEGNLLVDGGGLSGVVDWDAYRSDLVPGVDLVHLVATADRLRHRRSMGAELLTRPWSREPLRSLASAYFDRLGYRLDEDRWTATGIAWWLGQLADTLDRTPHLAQDAVWVERNIVAVLDRLG